MDKILKEKLEETMERLEIYVLDQAEIIETIESYFDSVKSNCTCIAFHKSDECYKLGCKAYRSNESYTGA